MSEIVGFVLLFLALVVIVGSILTGCELMDRRTLALAEDCVRAGGSWVPTGSGELCIGARR